MQKVKHSQKNLEYGEWRERTRYAKYQGPLQNYSNEDKMALTHGETDGPTGQNEA